MEDNIKIDIAKLQKDVTHIKSNIGDIKAYIETDRVWKENQRQDNDKRYTLNSETKNIKIAVCSLFTLLLGALAVLVPLIVNGNINS